METRESAKCHAEFRGPVRRARLNLGVGRDMCSEELPQVELWWEDGARQINECEYRYIDSIRESEELTLELMVTEAKVQAKVLVPETRARSSCFDWVPGHSERDATCRSFRLIFDQRHMLSYTVLNESYGRFPESPELFAGKLFRVFTPAGVHQEDDLCIR